MLKTTINEPYLKSPVQILQAYEYMQTEFATLQKYTMYI